MMHFLKASLVLWILCSKIVEVRILYDEMHSDLVKKMQIKYIDSQLNSQSLQLFEELQILR